jgi:hypothetical protein
MAISIDGPPQIVTLLIDGQENFIEMPLVARFGTSAT